MLFYHEHAATSLLIRCSPPHPCHIHTLLSWFLRLTGLSWAVLTVSHVIVITYWLELRSSDCSPGWDRQTGSLLWPAVDAACQLGAQWELLTAVPTRGLFMYLGPCKARRQGSEEHPRRRSLKKTQVEPAKLLRLGFRSPRAPLCLWAFVRQVIETSLDPK